MIERLNRPIKDILSKYISVNQRDYDKLTDGIVFAFKSTIHESTVMMPYKMVFVDEKFSTCESYYKNLGW